MIPYSCVPDKYFRIRISHLHNFVEGFEPQWDAFWSARNISKRVIWASHHRQPISSKKGRPLISSSCSSVVGRSPNVIVASAPESTAGVGGVTICHNFHN